MNPKPKNNFRPLVKDRAALAKLALALSASQQLGREELASKLQWLKASVKAGFSDLLEHLTSLMGDL